MNGDSTGSRMSTRSQSNSNSSPNLRKSHRLEGKSPPLNSPLKKKTENPSPLRRSGKDKDKGSPSSKGSKQQSNSKGGSSTSESKQDLTLKEIAKEVKGQSKQSSSSEVGSKKVKKRLDARSYRQMFKPLKKIKTSESETDSKRKLEYSDKNGSEPENAEVEQDKHNEGEELASDGKETVVDNAGVSDSVVNDNTCTDKPSELENGDNNPPSPSPRKESVENTDKTVEVPAEIEELPNGETLLASESPNSNGLGCSEKGVTSENEGVDTHSDDADFVPSSCKPNVLSEDCAKCSRKRSLERDSPEQELCCCISNTMNDGDDSKDRGQCGTDTAEFADENGPNVRESICGACQLSGKLLHCCGKGCKKSYHPKCSLNPEKDIYLPNWYCSECTKKRFAFGVHSVSRGVEWVLDVRDVELSTEGKPKQKQCFVKYKGLAHIHNRWLPEITLLNEVPELHEKVRKMDEGTEWNPVWAVPHRLLLRRSVTIDHTDHGMSLDTKSQYEWLVKWCDLDYDQATWESEDLSCFKSPEGQQLVKEYEARHDKARTAPLPVNNEVQEKKKGSHVKLGRHLVGGADNYYQNIVNKLREWHHKGQNGILLDEQDRLMKIIYLVSTLVSSVTRPFLIIAPHDSLLSWEAEFMRLASSISVVVYGGNSGARDIIRTVEFFDGGQVVQVLLSSAEIIAEDREELKGIEWEAVIVDDCQQSCILVHSGDIMNLATGWRLLLVNAQLQDNVSEYINILSLLEPGHINLNEDINVLRDKLSSFIISARFIEYWVPIEMSNLQLEQYCYSILSKSSVLQSISNRDPVGSLREILISLRKCCDHPYVLDMGLQSSLASDIPKDCTLVDVGVKASGKLYLLDKLLSELKNQGLKVLILFQPTGGSGRDSTGNILDDFVRFRFGSDSYEHIESGLQLPKKQNACNTFNTNKDRFILLLETRACNSSIKLSSVHAVILFNSDWNPLNDLRALQKITIDSKIDQIKVFRFYLPFTIEEKVLILAKNDKVLDSNLQITTSTSHMLLMWGPSLLFPRLDKFHNSNVSDYKDSIVFESSLFTDVTQEIIYLFRNPKLFISTKNISVAQQNGGCYMKNIPLIGEQNIRPDNVGQPHSFWAKLLEGLKPQWKYLSGSSQRSRKRVQYNELSLETQSEEVTKRRKKGDKTKIDISPLQDEPRLEGNSDPNPRKGDGNVNAEMDDLKNLHSEQRGLFEMLKPTMLQLFEALQLKDDEKRFIEQFLEYLVKNYRVIKEPETLLQAFLLSVCWTAIEGLKKSIDHNNSITIVREKLGFSCTESETEDIYSKLKPIFSRSGIKNQHPSGNLSPTNPESDFDKYRKKVEKRCEKKMEKLKVKHEEELKKFKKKWEDDRMKLEHWCKLETAAIRVTHATSLVAKDKLRALDNDYARKREELEREISVSFKELEARQKIEREEEQKKIDGFIERVNALELGPHAKNGINSNVSDKTKCNNYGNLLEKQNTDKTICDKNESNDNGSIKALEKVQEEPCGSTREAEEGTDLVNDVVEGNLTCRPSNQEGGTMGSSMKEVVTDTCQVLRTESHMEVEELVSNETGTNNSLTVNESSQSRSPNNHGSPNLPSTGERNNSTECSLDERNRVTPNTGLDKQLNDNNASIVGTTPPIHLDHSTSGVAFSQPHPQLTIDQSANINLVPLGGLSAHSSLSNRLQAPFPSISRVPPSFLDPLQLELERLRSELAKVMNHHEGTKLQLKSECEKEIEEVVAQIKKKYDKKAEEVEASFTQKKNELEMYQHKVMMNKILAEAFRSKCTDYKAAPKTPQLVIPSSPGSMESSSRSHHPRPSFPITSSLPTTPTASPYIATPPVQGVGPSTPFVPQSRMARTNPGLPPMTGQQQMAPLWSNPTTTPAMHHPVHVPQQSTSDQSRSNPNNLTHQEGSLVRDTLLSDLSIMELLTGQSSASQNSQYSGNVPQFPDKGPSSETGNMSQVEGTTNTQPNSSSLPADNVVCLSDDE